LKTKASQTVSSSYYRSRKGAADVTEAIQPIISEFRTLSPDIADALVFRLNGETLAATKNTTPEQTQSLINSLSSITHAECIGGVENFTIQDVNTQLTVREIGEIYLAIVSSRSEDQKIIKSLTEVIGPTLIRLASGSTAPEPQANRETIKTQRRKKVLESAIPKKDLQIPSIPEPQSPPEPPQPKAPTTQFMVERIGGILVPPDTVRIDGEVLEKWRELEGKMFAMVAVETLEGKKAICKFKPIRAISKGIIQIPDRLIQALDSGKGKLVMVKPVVE
jgi:hypothetical protein